MLFSGQGLDETEEGAVQALPTAKATLRNMSPVQQPMSLEGLWLKLHALILRPASQQLARDSISLSAFRVILCRKDRPEQWLSILQASHDYPQPLAYPFGYLELVNGSDAEGPFSELFEGVVSSTAFSETQPALMERQLQRCSSLIRVIAQRSTLESSRHHQARQDALCRIILDDRASLAHMQKALQSAVIAYTVAVRKAALLQHNLSGLQPRFAALREEKDMAERMAAGLATQAQNLQLDLRVLQDQHDGVTGLVHTLQGQNTALTGSVEDLQGHQRHLTRRVLQLEGQNVTLGEEAASLQKRLDVACLEQQEDVITIKRLQMEKEALRCKVADQEQGMVAQAQQLEAQEQRMHDQGEAVKGQKQQVVNLEQQVDLLSKLKDEQQGKAAAIMVAMQAQQAAAEDLQSQHQVESAGQRLQIQGLQQCLADKAEQLDKISAEHNDALEVHRSEVQQLTSQLSASTSVTTEQEAELSKKEAQVKRLDGELSEQQAKMKQLQSLVSEKDLELQRLSAEKQAVIEEQQGMIRSLGDRLTASQQEGAAAHREEASGAQAPTAATQDFEATIDALSIRLEEEQKDKAAVAEANEAAVQDLQGQLAEQRTKSGAESAVQAVAGRTEAAEQVQEVQAGSDNRSVQLADALTPGPAAQKQLHQLQTSNTALAAELAATAQQLQQQKADSTILQAELAVVSAAKQVSERRLVLLGDQKEELQHQLTAVVRDDAARCAKRANYIGQSFVAQEYLRVQLRAQFKKNRQLADQVAGLEEDVSRLKEQSLQEQAVLKSCLDGSLANLHLTQAELEAMSAQTQARSEREAEQHAEVVQQLQQQKDREARAHREEVTRLRDLLGVAHPAKSPTPEVRESELQSCTSQPAELQSVVEGEHAVTSDLGGSLTASQQELAAAQQVKSSAAEAHSAASQEECEGGIAALRPRLEEQQKDKAAPVEEVKREQMEEQQGAAAARPAASMALCTAASLQRALSNDDDDDTMFWDFGPAAGQRGNDSVPAPAAAQPAGQADKQPPASQQWQSPQSSPRPPPNKPIPWDSPASPETIKMSSEFKTWASQEICSLSKGGIDDPSTLLDVLMDTLNDGEVVEGCLINIQRNVDVSAFASEFIRRKAAEMAGHYTPQSSPGPPPNKPMPWDIPASPETIKMSSEFKTWASQKIRSLSKGGIDDPSTLLDVLLNIPSNGEVVEGCLANIERNADVSAFASEFIRRKAAEMAGHKGDAKAVSAAVPFGSSSAAAPIPAAAASDPSQFQEVSKAKKGKKGKASKGQKVGN